MKFSPSISFDYNDIDIHLIEKALLHKVQTTIYSQKKVILDSLRSELYNIYTSTEEYTSLTSGALMGHFGLKSSRAEFIVKKIINTFTKELEIFFYTDGSFSINAIKSSFDQILSLKEAKYTSNDYEIPWLDWFLVSGDYILVDNYHIQFISNSRTSRSKIAIMNKGGTYTKSDFLKSVSGYNGTPTSNWITHTIDEYKEHLKKVLSKIITKAMKA